MFQSVKRGNQLLVGSSLRKRCFSPVTSSRWSPTTVLAVRVLHISVKPPDLIDNGATNDLDMLNLDDLAGAHLESL